LISLRYHLVSIVAIFLALALGLIIGASALQKPVESELQTTNNQLHNDAESLRQQLQSQQAITSYDDQVTSSTAPRLLAGMLTGQSIVIVNMPGADATARNGVFTMAKDAGATITGTLTINDKYIDTTQTSALWRIAVGLRQADSTMPPSYTTYQRVAAELAAVLVTPVQRYAGTEAPAVGQVLSAYENAGFLSEQGNLAARSTLALVVAPSSPNTDDNSGEENTALVDLTAALGTGSVGTVMAGPAASATDGGLIAAVRGGNVDGKISTVDSADITSGQVTTVLAFAEQVEHGKSADYGYGSGASSALPSPVPSAVPTPSNTPTTTKSPKKKA
jgi:hypothetical protein